LLLSPLQGNRQQHRGRERHRGDLPRRAGSVRAGPARLLRLDRGQPAGPCPALHLVGFRRGRPGHPRGAAPGRAWQVPPPHVHVGW